MKHTFKLSIFFIRYIKQILTAFYSGHSLKLQALGDVKP